MKPTSIAGLYECMDQWGDSPVTKRTCKRIAHKADRKHGRQVAKNWSDDYQDVWTFWGDDASWYGDAVYGKLYLDSYEAVGLYDEFLLFAKETADGVLVACVDDPIGGLDYGLDYGCCYDYWEYECSICREWDMMH